MAGLGGTALLVLIGLGALAMSAGTKKHSDEDEPTPASSSSATSASAAIPTATAEPTATAPTATPSSPAACRVTKEAVRIAAKASKDVPLELAVAAGGDRARIGFSTDASAAQGLSIDLASFKMAPEFAARAYKVRAVIPLAIQNKNIFVINSDGKRDRLQAWRTLSIDPPIVVGWADNAVSVAAKAGEPPHALWTLDGDAMPDTIRSADAGERGVAVVFRRRGGIFGGFLGKDRSPHGGLTQIAGAGAPEGSPVGSPSLAVSGSTIAVAFADRASASEPWSLRIGASSVGSFPAQTSQFAVPPGGPGGAAIAPALAGLADGRFLLAWTEGSGGSHDVRAQTLAADLKPLGAPFSVSHSGGNAGQGAAAVSAGKGLVAYLALTDNRSYEVWGAGHRLPMIAILSTKSREGRAWFRRAAMVLLFLLPSCMPARQVTVGETQVGQGLLYQSSNPTYDKFFEETHALQVLAMSAPDEEKKALVPLEQALGAPKTTPEQLAELAKTRAKKLDGSPLRLTATGLPRDKWDDKGAHVTAALSVSDEVAVAASEKDFVKSSGASGPSGGRARRQVFADRRQGSQAVGTIERAPWLCQRRLRRRKPTQ